MVENSLHIFLTINLWYNLITQLDAYLWDIFICLQYAHIFLYIASMWIYICIFISLNSTILRHYGLIYEHHEVLIKIRMLFMSISNIWNARIFKFTSCTNKLQQLNTSILGSFCLKRNNLTIIQQKLETSNLCVLVS